MTDERLEEGESTAASIRLAALKGLERFAYLYSPVIFMTVSLFGGVTVYLYGFFWNLQKGMASIIDTSFVANLTLQLAFLVSLIGLIVRALPSIINSLLPILFAGEVDSVWIGAQKRIEGATRFIFVPSVIFVSLVAFLDFVSAALFAIEALILLGALVSFIYVSERQMGNKKHPKEIYQDVALKIREKQFLNRYQRFPAVCVGVLLAGLFLLGDAKFSSLVRQKPVDFYFETSCVRARMLGATSNGVVVLGTPNKTRYFFSKSDLEFVPFSRVKRIASSNEQAIRCN